MSKEKRLYDLLSAPLVVGRVPSLPVQMAVDVLAAADPLEATRRVFRTHALARQAIAVASPTLAAAIDEWIADQPLRNTKTPLRALAYLLRMSTRATPFGLCAGIGEVQLDDVTTIAVADVEQESRTRTRPDMELLMKVAKEVEESDLREDVRYLTNESAFVRGDRVYVTDVTRANTVPVNGGTLTEQREISLKNTAAVVFVRELCTTPLPLKQIAEQLCARFEAPPEAASKLLGQLIEAGIIISELRPSPLGDPVAYLAERLAAIGAPSAVLVREAIAQAQRLDGSPLSQRSAQDYLDVQQRFTALASDTRDGAAVQIDLRSNFQGTLNKAVVDDATRLAEYYVRMGTVTSLEPLRKRFLERYEGTERMVPLLELVDNNVGLGMPDSIERETKENKERDALLVRLACEAQRSAQEEIALDEEQLKIIAPPLRDEDRAVPSIEIGFQVVAESAQAVDRGEYLVAPSGFLVSDSATKSLGRFAHLFDDAFVARATEIAHRTVPPDTIVAELAFTPVNPRSYNVMTRPLLYDYEIRTGIGSPPAGEPITPDDLWVGLENGRFFLWSQSRKRRVQVRETHAFGTQSFAPNLCRMLSLLRFDGARALSDFDWGGARNCTYLPRVRAGRVVLSLRQWQFARSSFGKTQAQAAAELTRVRALWGLPRYVYLAEMDHRLLLDLDSPVAAAMLEDQAPQEKVVLIEAMPAPDAHCWIPGARGTHAVEFIANGATTQPMPSKPAIEPVLMRDRVVHGPGSSWVYAKLYLGKQAADNFIATVLAPLAQEMQAQGAVDRWFFLRYGDPDNHVRVRFHATGEADALRKQFNAFAEGWLQETRILRYAFDTYNPEYERYGGAEQLPDVERFFTQNSALCASIIASGGSETDRRVAVAAQTFLGYLRDSQESAALALRTLASSAKQKMSSEDRESLRRINGEPPVPDMGAVLVPAMAFGDREKRLLDLLHMHCNRLGLDQNAERRVRALLRALVLAQSARANRQEPALTA